MTTPVLPPASYPGTLKTFTTKIDGQVVYGEHANEWQEEITAMQAAVGLNPQKDYQDKPYLDMSARLDYLEKDTVRLEGNQLISGTKEFKDTVQVDGALISNNAPVTLKYATRQFYFYNSGLQQYAADGITAKDMTLQPAGGQVFRGGNRMWDSGNDGPNSGLDADTLDGHQASDFLIKSGIVVQMSADQSVPFNPPGATVDPYWRKLGLNTVVYENTPGDGNVLWDTPSNTFLITPGLWVANWNIAWEAPDNGSRGLRGVPDSIPVNSSPTTWNDSIYFGGQHYTGLAPNWWPTTGLTAPNFYDLDSNTDVFFATKTFKMRVDVWNYCTAAATIHHDGNTHLHQPTSVAMARIA